MLINNYKSILENEDLVNSYKYKSIASYKHATWKFMNTF